VLLRLAACLLALPAALALAPLSRADVADETALAARYAPIVRLVEQEEECGYGEPYVPIDVDRLFGEPTVALRGPWGSDDLVAIGPSAADLGSGLYEYHLDFPGSALDPGCGYERWSDRLVAGSQPTAYAHVATDPGHPGLLALQYWFFYAFNDFNNKHEGDWEMVQLLFEAGDARAALSVEPTEVGYSQHEGAERATWGDEKLELVGSTHPVVHPAAGSHANYFDDALHFGRTAEQGVGCDDTSSPTVDVRPVVRTIPSDEAAARRAFPWIAYEGRWGELQESFYNGPTGPNLKLQWREPVAWAEEKWRDKSYALPGGGLLGTSATDLFCGAVRGGSDVVRLMIQNPVSGLIVFGSFFALALFVITRTTWTPAAPLRVARRRAWGQTLAAASRMYVARWRLFVGIALAFLPVTAINAVIQTALFDTSSFGVGRGGELGGTLALLTFAVGAMLTLAGLGLVQAVTTRALVEIDAGREIDALGAYRLALQRFPGLLKALAIAVAVVVVLGLTLAFVPVAVWLGGRWALTAQAVELEHATAFGALRRSSRLVRRRWLKVATLVLAGGALALALGPVVGALLILVTDAPAALLNVVAGVVYVLAMPLVALTTSYVYFDAVVRERLEPAGGRGELESELPRAGAQPATPSG
jgi:hypothetical protein